MDECRTSRRGGLAGGEQRRRSGGEEGGTTADVEAADATTNIAVIAVRHDDAVGRRGGSGCDDDCHCRGASGVIVIALFWEGT